MTTANIGTITAKATNEFGAMEKSCQLDCLDLPKILNKLDNVTVNEGELTKFIIKFTGKPKPTIKWFKDDVEFAIDEFAELIETAEDECTLNIKSRQSKHSGSISAKAINEFGEAVSNKAVLTVNRAPKFVSQPKDTVGIQDQPAKFECIVDAMPKAKITWNLNGKELTAKDNVKFEADAKTNVTALVIPKVNASFFGAYVIKASNQVGESEVTFNLDVFETPKISGKLENVTVNQGEDARFVLKLAGGKPKPTIKWFKEEEEIVANETYELVEVEDTYQLVIKAAKPEYAGNFYAKLTNEAGQVNSNKAQLIVKFAPQLLNQLEDLVRLPDESGSFKILVLKTAIPVKVEWLKDDKPIKVVEPKYLAVNNEEEYSFTFTIQNLVIADAGRYSVNVSNIFGKSTSQARMFVRSAPAIVTKLKDIEVVEGTTASSNSSDFRLLSITRSGLAQG